LSSITILQSSFAPNIHDLKAMASSDCTWLLGGDRWSRKGRSHRAAIQNAEHLQWAGIPIRTEDKKKMISQVRIDGRTDWTIPFLNAIKHSYSNAPFYDFYWREFEALILKASQVKYLWDFNQMVLPELLEFISYHHLLERMEYISGEVDWSLLHKFDYCVQEHASHTYMTPIRTASSSYDATLSYGEHHKSFFDQLSIIDLLFEVGPESFKVLDS
jgi:hypothetical protein